MRYKIGTKWKCIGGIGTFEKGEEYYQLNETDTIEKVTLENKHGEGGVLGEFKDKFVEVDEKEMRKRKIDGLCIILNDTVKKLTEELLKGN